MIIFFFPVLSCKLSFLFPWVFFRKTIFQGEKHCPKSVRIQSYSGPYSVRMWENTDQKKSEIFFFCHNMLLFNLCEGSQSELQRKNY